MFILINIYLYFRDSCAINLGQTVVITGNFNKKHGKNVTEYDVKGFVAELPELSTARYNHACTSYDNDDGTKVDSDKSELFVVSSCFRHYLSLAVLHPLTLTLALPPLSCCPPPSCWLFPSHLMVLRFGSVLAVRTFQLLFSVRERQPLTIGSC